VQRRAFDVLAIDDDDLRKLLAKRKASLDRLLRGRPGFS
jgi:ATP-dependent DNA ligase